MNTPKIQLAKFNENDLLKKFLNNEEAFESFDNVVNSSLALNREAYVGAIDDTAAEGIETVIRYWNRIDDEAGIPIEDRKPIKLYIDSWGGMVVGAYTIINAIELSKTPVWTINIGAAYSAGFFIFITGHKRFAYPFSSFLYHEGGTGNDYMDAHKFRNQAAFYEKQLQQLKEHTLRYTNLTEEEYQKIIKDDYWLTAPEALEKGVCDEIAKEFV